ncbi:hypothetical protein [Paenibacillus sonchi]|uniref:hypothetical protein n=1 Tax=Paenibacillus sonchi TaxID=373687 RepID=UPI001F247364|nr:hypothetical protein [Paenibacillus sonchi]
MADLIASAIWYGVIELIIIGKAAVIATLVMISAATTPTNIPAMAAKSFQPLFFIHFIRCDLNGSNTIFTLLAQSFVPSAFFRQGFAPLV